MVANSERHCVLIYEIYENLNRKVVFMFILKLFTVLMTKVMKKIFSMLFIAAMCCMAMVSCGNEDEPEKPVRNIWETVHESESDIYYQFYIDTQKDSSSIFMYNIVFTIGDRVSPAMTIRVDAPLTVDKSGQVFTYAGTGIAPYMMMGSGMIQLTEEDYLVNNLTCVVDTKNRTYDIKFDCHGGRDGRSKERRG